MKVSRDIRRPVLRWHGGKWKLAPWILQHMPEHRVYVEPFGGAASILIRKPRSYAEVYNDLDDEVVSLFRVLRDPVLSLQLLDALRLTPFARTEFRDSYEQSEDPIERGRRLVIRSFMGFGSNAHASEQKGHRSTGFRATSNRSGTTPAMDWAGYPNALPALIERLKAVVIECRPAREVMAQHDGLETLHYVDPPYLPETRARGNRYDLAWRMYRHELSREDHAELLIFLCELEGMVMLSGYPDPLYETMLGVGWRRVECKAYADGARERVEVMWLNHACANALDDAAGRHAGGHGTPLFSEAS